MTQRLMFSAKSMVQFSESLHDQLKRAINQVRDDEILHRAPEELVTELTLPVLVEFPVLGEPILGSVERKEIRGQAHGFPGFSSRVISGRPVVGLETVLEVPFTGDRRVFDVRPNLIGGVSDPMGDVTADAVLIVWHAPGSADQSQVKAFFYERIVSIKTYLGRVEPAIEQLNRALLHTAQSRIAQRRAQISADRDMAAGLGFAIKRRTDPSIGDDPTRTALSVEVDPPDAAATTQTPLPTLAADRFEQAVATLMRAGVMFERSPSTTRKMNESDLRNLMLVVLNDRFEFEGFVGAEVFNSSGRTDILVRVAGVNVLVGECKFNDGPQTVLDTLDQVLRYLAWRDEKAVVIMFYKQAGYTKLISESADVIDKHPQCAGRVSQIDGTRYDFNFHAQDDDHRAVHLVFLPFAIKQARTSNGELLPDV